MVSDFSSMVHPTEPKVFWAEFWEKKPLLIKRDSPLYYESLLSLRDVDKFLAASSIRRPDIRILKEGREIPLPTSSETTLRSLAAEGVYQHFREGATLSLVFLHERWMPLKRLCQSLADEFSAAFQVNVYLTPPHSQGLDTHYDTHDVFVLQAAGSKHWRLYNSPIELPLATQRWGESSGPAGDPVEEFDLEPGDALYIPRGFVHDAATKESISLHLTIGAHPILWRTVLLDAFEALCERKPLLRKALPVGFAQDDRGRTRTLEAFEKVMHATFDGLDASAAIENAVAVARSATGSSLEGHLIDLGQVDSLSSDTRVMKRPDVYWRLSRRDANVTLSYHGKVVETPAHTLSALEFVTSSDSFTAADLPGPLDVESKKILVRRLVREGFLTVAGN